MMTDQYEDDSFIMSNSSHGIPCLFRHLVMILSEHIGNTITYSAC